MKGGRFDLTEFEVFRGGQKRQQVVVHYDPSKKDYYLFSSTASRLIGSSQPIARADAFTDLAPSSDEFAHDDAKVVWFSKLLQFWNACRPHEVSKNEERVKILTDLINDNGGQRTTKKQQEPVSKKRERPEEKEKEENPFLEEHRKQLKEDRDKLLKEHMVSLEKHRAEHEAQLMQQVDVFFNQSKEAIDFHKHQRLFELPVPTAQKFQNAGELHVTDLFAMVNQ
jgi:hypothetical protein